ncbi:MAG: hypothetical protein KDD51_02595 [Bdellovibrionales bacterium]|nr:hypothetical protein [Bdellovibrionales bacterium]
MTSAEKTMWLGAIEALVRRGTGQLDEAQLAQIEARVDLDAFYETQTPDIKKAIDATISLNGNGLEVLLSELEEILET